MWYEIHWCKFIRRFALYEGTADGYKITKVYTNKLTAKVSAKINGYRFCK